MPRGAFAPAFALIRCIVYDLNLPLNPPVKDGIAAYHFMPSLKGQRVCQKRRLKRNCLQHCQSSQRREIERKGWADEHCRHDFEKPVQEEKGQKI